jgi:two-component system, OmpR family, response regulator
VSPGSPRPGLVSWGSAHTELNGFSCTTLTAVCCDDVMTHEAASLLVVEDEPFLRKAVVASLRFVGFQVADTEDGSDALRLARGRQFDLLILDVMLPGIDGFEIAHRLRRDGNQVPVIFLTAKDASDDKVTGLNLGGDDYLTKPFELEELVARVRAVLRRSRPTAPEPVLSFADLTLDQDTYEVRRGGRLIELSPTEFRLLRYFMVNPGRVLTRAQLLSNVWDCDFGGSSTVVSTYVAYLRRKLAGNGPDLIHTQRAVGFILRLPRHGDEPGVSDVHSAHSGQPAPAAGEPGRKPGEFR